MLQGESNRVFPKTVYLAFGSNQETQLAGSAEIIRSAYTLLSNKTLTSCVFSPFYQTPAFPAGNGPDYVNSVVKAETMLSPQELLAELHSVETNLGRIRKARWGSRIIDIDLLDYQDCILPSLDVYKTWAEMPLELQITKWPDDLILPHPRIQDRGFVLVPLRAVAPNWIHPVSAKTIDALIEALDVQELSDIVQI